MIAPSYQARLFIDSVRHDATRLNRPVCLDSGPLIDYLASLEPVTTLLEPLIADESCPLVISTVTVAEVVARPAQSGNIERVHQIETGLVDRFGIAIIDFNREHAIRAAIVRGQTQLKLPDAAIIATAQIANASALIGNDKQWRNKSLGVPYYHLDYLLARS